MYAFLFFLSAFFIPVFGLANGGCLSFDEAMARTLCNSPKLKVSMNDIDVMIGLGIQSRLLPNPVVSYSVENVFGNKAWRGWRSAESRYALEQMIEFGGKRAFRSRLADYQLCATEASLKAQELWVLNILFKRFIDAAAAQEQWNLACEQLKIAEEVFRTISSKVEAGKVSLIQQSKAEIDLARAKIVLEQSIIDFSIAKEQLASLWGCSCPDFESISFPFYAFEIPECLDDCLEELCDHPELLKIHYDCLSAGQNLNLEKSMAIPDLTVLVGYKTENHSGNHGMIFGAAIPIPAFNKNQGGIQMARAEVQKIHDLYFDLQLALETKLSNAHKALMRAYKEVEQFNCRVLKAAERSFELAKEGYKEGKFEYFDMLDSERTLFEMKERYIQALVNYHRSKADIEFLSSQD